MNNSIWFWLLGMLCLTGCAAPTQQVSQGKQLPQATLERAADQAYENFESIHAALLSYRAEHGHWPRMTNPISTLVTAGYLDAIPEPIDPVFWSGDRPGSYHFDTAFDDMDGGTTADIVLRNSYYIDTFCRTFIAKYASDVGDLRTEIFDYDYYGNAYPGEILGKEAIIYAINYGSNEIDKCELHWVMEYKH